MAKVQKHAGKSQCPDESPGTSCPALYWWKNHNFPKRKRCPQLLLILGIKPVQTSLHIKITKVFSVTTHFTDSPKFLISSRSLHAMCSSCPSGFHLSEVNSERRAYFYAPPSKNPVVTEQKNCQDLVTCCYYQQGFPMALRHLRDH